MRLWTFDDTWNVNCVINENCVIELEMKTMEKADSLHSSSMCGLRRDYLLSIILHGNSRDYLIYYGLLVLFFPLA